MMDYNQELISPFTPFVLSEPMECFINRHLSLMEKKLLDIILNMCRSEEGCCKTNEFFTSYLDCSESTIANSIGNLKRYGYIKIKVRTTKNPDGSFRNERKIYNNHLYPLIYEQAVKFFFSNISMLAPKILWDEIEKRIPDLDSIQTFLKDNDFDYNANLKKLNFAAPKLKKLKPFIYNTLNTNTKTEETNKLVPSFSGISNKRKNALVVDSQERETQDGREETPIPVLIKHRNNKSAIAAMEASKPPIIRKLNRRQESIPKKPSIRELASNGMKAAAEKQKVEHKGKKKIIPFQNIEDPIQEAIDLWEQLKFPPLNKEKAPGRFNNTIRALRKIQTGKLIPDEKRKFSIEEVKNAMIRFSMLAFDDCGFYSPESRKKFAEKTLECFLYSPAYGDILKKYPDFTQSWFVKCHDMKEEPKKVDPVIDVPDLHPNITNKLRSFYFKYALAGMKSNLTPREESKFREGANKLCAIYDRYRQRFAGVNGYNEFADIFCQAMKHSYGNKTTMIHPSTFNTSNSRATMIAFMNEMGYIPDADFQVDF